MASKVICESCGTSYKYEIVKDMELCPVCGASFDDSIHYADEKIDFEHPDMYFYDIDDEEDNEEEDLRDVWCQCTFCRKVNPVPLNQFSLIKSEYVKLKENVLICCKGCGKTVNNMVVPKRPDGWKELNMWVTDWKNQPKCPVCSSTKIHKISLTNKAASALAFGVLSAGHVSKTYKCDTCGAKF